MNTLTRFDAVLASWFRPIALPPTPSKRLGSPPVETTVLQRRLSNLPPTRKQLKRRITPKPTSTSIQLPPPSTPVLLRIFLALWSILLAFWRSLVGETRAERVKRVRKQSGAAHRALRSTAAGAGASSDEGSASEAEPPGSESGGEAGGDNDVDPVTRASEGSGPLSEAHDFAPPSDSARGPNGNFTFRLRSAEQTDGLPAEQQAVPERKTFQRQPTPPSILSNPMPSPRATRQPRLLPNPMSTSLLDPSVPAVPASKTSMSFSSTYATKPHQTPFHHQKTLILDLDETLIHSTSRPLSYAASSGGGLLGLSFGGLLGGRKSRKEGHTVEVVLNGRSTMYHVYKRPYVDHFLKKVAAWYTLVIFTASMPEYADPVIEWLDGGRGLFSKKLYRESCHLQQNGSYVKDLALVEADLSRVCFMDNSPVSYTWNKANALPIEGWTSDPNDEALLQCIPVLDSLRFVNDVRRILGIRGFS